MRGWMVLFSLMLLAAPVRAEEPGSVASTLPTDLVVTIRHLDGTVERFGQEIASMDIVVAPDSSIRYVHLVLVTGAEKDTHAWYNYDQIAGFRYQFTSITGKGKVRVKQLGEFQAAERAGMQETIPVVGVEDFK